jgi:hypothetical protein
VVVQGAARLTVQDTGEGLRALVHHIMSNSELFKEKPLPYFEYPLDYAPALEMLLGTYPEYVRVDALPFPMLGDDDEVTIPTFSYQAFSKQAFSKQAFIPTFLRIIILKTTFLKMAFVKITFRRARTAMRRMMWLRCS